MGRGRMRFLGGEIAVVFLILVVGAMSDRFEGLDPLVTGDSPFRSCDERRGLRDGVGTWSAMQESQLSDEEVEVMLKEFWNATGGPYWTTYRWDFVGPWYCWPGITAESDGWLAFEVPGNNLTGTFPDSLGLLPFVYLSFSFNDISGTLPRSLCETKTITSLIIAANRLEGTIPECIGEIQHGWESISLGANRLSGPIPESLLNATHLSFLSLSDNAFNGTLSNGIGAWTNLKVLELSNNSFSGTLPESFGQMSKLSQLYLGYNQLSGTLPIGMMRGLNTSLSKLLIPHNHFEGSMYPITRLSHVSVINISNNRFTAPLLELRYLPKIVYLDFSHNHIEDVITPDQLIMFRVADLSYYNAVGNKLKPSGLPTFPFRFTGDTQLKTSTENWACKVVSAYDTGLTFMVDPSFFHYAHCTCIRGYYGHPPDHCFPCPVNAGHCENGITLSVPTNQHPYPIGDPPKTNDNEDIQSKRDHDAQTASTTSNLEQDTWSRLWRAIQGIEDADFVIESPQEASQMDRKNDDFFEKFEEISQSQGGIFPSSQTPRSSAPLDQPVFFEPCHYRGACGDQCQIRLWTDSSNLTRGYLEAPPGVPESQCHCHEGYTGRQCAKCLCDVDKDPDTCYYPSSSCRKCSTVWRGNQTFALFTALIILLFIVSTVVHVIVLRNKRKQRETSMEEKSILKRAFYRLMHVRTIGYFKLFLIWIQTLSAIVDWPTNALHQIWGLIEITNGNPAGIGIMCLWPALRLPVLSYLLKAFIPIALIAILSLSIFVAHTIWIFFLRPKNFQHFPMLKADGPAETLYPEYSRDSDLQPEKKRTKERFLAAWEPCDDSDADPIKNPSSMLDDGSSSDRFASEDDNPRTRLLEIGEDSHFSSFDRDSASSVSNGSESNGDYGKSLILGDGVRYFSARSLIVSEALAISYFFYFGITLASLAFFACVKQEGTGTSFMQSAPWIRCDGAVTRDLRIFSIPVLIILTAGVPILFASLLLYYRKQLHKRTVTDIIGGLYRCYRKKLFWWELVILARRLGLALAIRIEKSSSFHPWSIILILSVSVALQFLFQPFHQRGENRAEELSLLLLILTYAAQEGARAASIHITSLFWLTFALNCIFMAITISLLIRSWCTGSVKIDDE